MRQDLSDNGVSRVWIEDGWVYKEQPKYMTDNEVYALDIMKPTGFVPVFEQVGVELIRMKILNPEPVTDKSKFRMNFGGFLNTMCTNELRHGDLTRPHVFPVENKPVVIDFGESRFWGDPRKDKRREGDRYWMMRTCREILDET